MGIPVEQAGQKDPASRNREADGRKHPVDERPRSFEEYLASTRGSARRPEQSAPGRESLAQLVERARRTPRIG